MNLHTLQLEHVILLVVYTLLAVANARLQRGMRGVKFLVLYSVMALLGAIAVESRGSLPDFVSIVVGNACVMAAYASLYVSMSRLFRFSARQDVLAGLWVLVGCCWMVWYGALRPDTPKRLFALSLVLALQQLHLAFLLVARNRARRDVAWTMAGMLAGLAGANAFRMAVVVLQGAPQDYRQSGLALAAVVLANSCFQCGIMVAYIWMAAALLRRNLEVQATTDSLTGLLNRRALCEAAEQEIRSCSHEATVFSAVLVDLDEYKPINDRLGHAAGDQALVAVSDCLRRELRTGDLLARSGGDEFVVLLPRTDYRHAIQIAERLRFQLQRLDLGLSDRTVQVTGSFGVAQAGGGELWNQTLSRCDAALYTAKRQGGNAVICHEAGEPSSWEDMVLSLQ